MRKGQVPQVTVRARPEGAVTAALLRENAILRHLGAGDAERVLATARLIEMPPRYFIYGAGEMIDEVYFPIDSVLSIVTQMKGGEMIEVGTIGREGTSGIPLLMGGTTTANDCYCQVPGLAIRIPATEFHKLKSEDSTFGALLNRYLQAYVNFLGQLTACNRLHSVYERSARWLLLSHDRVLKDDILLTHEYLAMMLGSRRSGVTIALATLQRAGFIHYARGRITVLDRGGLEETTCECYAIAREQFGGFLHFADGTERRVD
jgi:CRP-like cAMP-binding protein